MGLQFRRHYPLLIATIIFTALIMVGLGNQRIIPYSTQSNTPVVEDKGAHYTNEIALFDDSIVHSFQILMSDEDYQLMLTTYKQTGRKDYFHADVIIDGVRVSDVGVRLKGNASLKKALGARMNARGAQPQGSLSSNQVEKFPLLVKFNQFVTGQRYQGYTSIAIRTYGVSYDAALLNEPVTYAVFRAAGLPIPQSAYAGVRLNEGSEQLYTISDVINQTYIDHHFPDTKGVLYKAEVGTTLRYQGEDPSLYARSFTQQTRVNDADFGPLIEFMRFLTESDEAAFTSELENHLDVDSYATYLAINNLLVNADSMAGMGNNFYLYYDETRKRFTILMWDGNESMGKLGGGGGLAASYDLYYTSQQGMMKGRGGQNILVTRFLANNQYKALYEQKLTAIYRQAFTGGEILRNIDHLTAVLRQANLQRNLVPQSSYDQAVNNLLSFVSQRSAYLKTTALLGGQSNLSR